MRHQVNRRILPSSIDFDIEFQPIAFVKFPHPRTFDSANMHECIGLPVVTGDEAEALHRIEELDRTGCLFAGQLTLRRGRLALCDGDHIADNDEIAGRDLSATIDKGEFKALAFCQTFETGTLNCADVNKDVFATIFALHEAETLLGIEELDDALALADDLGRHAAATAATARATEAATTAAAAWAATEAAAITAAETTATTAAAAKAITTTKAVAAAETVATTEAAARERIETFFAETVPLVATLAATSSIETHKPKRTFASPHSHARTARTIPAG
jgi:hypothetical protein